MRLALDHLTIVDSNPLQLVEAARVTGCDAVCLFLEAMDFLPSMPPFSLIRDRDLRKQFRHALEDTGVHLDLAYPFTLTGRTEISTFEAALECAAELGASSVNVLSYDRIPKRQGELFAAFCELANAYGLNVALEFYPVSQVRSLSEATCLVEAVGRVGRVGVNVDLLHLMRSGGIIGELKAARQFITYGQICDGPASRPHEELEFEASCDRLLPGQGTFDVDAFIRELPSGCPISVEAPRSARVTAGILITERAHRAVEAAKDVMPSTRRRS